MAFAPARSTQHPHPHTPTQVTQGRLGVSAANPLLAPTAGILAVGLGSLSASFAADRAPALVCAALRVALPPGAYGAHGGWTLFAGEDMEGDPEAVALRGKGCFLGILMGGWCVRIVARIRHIHTRTHARGNSHAHRPGGCAPFQGPRRQLPGARPQRRVPPRGILPPAGAD